MAAILANIGWGLLGMAILTLVEAWLLACYLRKWDEPVAEMCCDGCDRRLAFNGESYEKMIEAMKTCGWTPKSAGGPIEYYCPECSRERERSAGRYEYH